MPPDRQIDGKTLLSRVESAEYLRVSTRTLDYKIASGEIARIKIGRRVLVSIQELNRYVEDNTVLSDAWKAARAGLS